MTANITVLEINTLVDQQFTAIGRIPSLQNHKLVTKAAAVRVLTALNANWEALAQAGNAGNHITLRSFTETLKRCLAVLGDVGTTTSADYTGLSFIPLSEANAGTYIEEAEAPITTSFTTLILAEPQLTIRRFARLFVQMAVDFAQANRIRYQVGIAHGIPIDLAHIGTDFADFYAAKTNREARALNLAKRAGLFREAATADPFSNSSRYYGEGYAEKE